MNIHSDAYPEPIDRLQNENKYLKEEIREEKKKLESTIRVLNKEIEELKKKNTTLNNKLTDVEVQNKSLLLQVEKFEKIIKGRFYTI
jgi:seryl-tRNA synthetase|tara:strand:- start:98 stop:358 length:261 start_codon:yes stop_codon:yes gene_type:complete